MHLKTTKCNNFCLVATPVDHEIFGRPQIREQFEALFRAFDPGTSFQFFKSFRRVRINFTDALAAAEARVKLHKSDFNGKEMRLYFAQSVHIGSPRLEPPKPEKQFLISPPASPPVGWAQSQDATPVINYDLLCAVSKLGPGEQYELHSGTTNTPSVIVHVCEDDSSEGEDETAEGGKRARPKIIQTRRPDYVPSVNQKHAVMQFVILATGEAGEPQILFLVSEGSRPSS
ncbi:Calcipressin-1 [Labeo rohita]|uniref:Calcipressin-1 n=2 Tax=Labeo rohita TaxID=84645 RepID=A0ABQ8N165_LABRO|nr:Calcipressin-1 [Labeo rohita]